MAFICLHILPHIRLIFRPKRVGAGVGTQLL